VVWIAFGAGQCPMDCRSAPRRFFSQSMAEHALPRMFVRRIPERQLTSSRTV